MYRAIETYYRGATNTKGARIYARDMVNIRNKLSVSYYSDDNEDAHHRAAQQLKEKLGWKGRLVGGGTKRGMVWVFVE